MWHRHRASICDVSGCRALYQQCKRRVWLEPNVAQNNYEAIENNMKSITHFDMRQTSIIPVRSDGFMLVRWTWDFGLYIYCIQFAVEHLLGLSQWASYQIWFELWWGNILSLSKWFIYQNHKSPDKVRMNDFAASHIREHVQPIRNATWTIWIHFPNEGANGFWLRNGVIDNIVIMNKLTSTYLGLDFLLAFVSAVDHMKWLSRFLRGNGRAIKWNMAH